MSSTTYKRLGDYIRQVDVRNKDLSITNLVGLTIDKLFIPSVANTIGTDFSNYKIIRKNQFACSLMQVSRDGKIPIAMYLEDAAIMSPAYPMFEVANQELLLPEYLMLWFMRSEFDREASFYAVGGVRGSLEWNDFCNMKLPVPPIEEQRRIVAQYKALENRIRNNERLIARLEDTAQSIFRHRFVDSIDPNNLPNGWKMGCLTDCAEYLNGLACQKYESQNPEDLKVLKIRELSQGCCDSNSDRVKDIPSKFVINAGDVIFSWSATLMIKIWAGERCALNQHLFKVSSDTFPIWFYYFWTLSHIENWKRLISAKATSMGHIKREDLENAEIIIPPNSMIREVDSIISPIQKYQLQLNLEDNILRRILSNLLTNLA